MENVPGRDPAATILWPCSGGEFATARSDAFDLIPVAASLLGVYNTAPSLSGVRFGSENTRPLSPVYGVGPIDEVGKEYCSALVDAEPFDTFTSVMRL